VGDAACRGPWAGFLSLRLKNPTRKAAPGSLVASRRVILVLGAGYIGAAVAQRALADGEDVVLADNWYATDEAQLRPLEARGAEVVTVDIREPDALRPLLAHRPRKVVFLAAQASRPLGEREPDTPSRRT
jgi:nucleoside-diphosphate-sugar epimerase